MEDQNSVTKNPIFIIGSGLAGLSAAYFGSKSNPMQKFIILEKQPQIGGNSIKASSGINGSETILQKKLNIFDSVDSFINDTQISANLDSNSLQICQDNELIKILCQESQFAIKNLIDELNVDLSVVSCLGGHSNPRTHRTSKGGVGFSLVNAFKQSILKNQNIEIVCKKQMKDILINKEGYIEYIIFEDEEGKEIQKPCNSIIMATGGFSHDFINSSLIKEFRADLIEMPTTNGDFATGDGIKVGRQLGAKLIDMDKIQIHPSGFLDPNNPQSISKILAPESLRGCGAILINYNGERFVNELTYRAKIYQAMQKQEQKQFYLLMNQTQKEKFGPNFMFYLSKQLFKEYENCDALLNDYDLKKLKQTLNQYQLDVQNGKDEFGKTQFKGGIKENEIIFIAQITPVLHYTMGGLKINQKCHVINENEEVIKGFYAAGECTGGLHGNNRLVGNSLLECCVFGKIAGENAVQFQRNFK